MPRLLLRIVLPIIQSMVTKNYMGDTTQPWRTPLMILNQSVNSFFTDSTTREIVVKGIDDADNLPCAPIG